MFGLIFNFNDGSGKIYMHAWKQKHSLVVFTPEQQERQLIGIDFSMNGIARDIGQYTKK